MAFNSEEWKNRLLKTGDYEAYMRAGAKATATRPHDYYVTQEAWVKGQVEHYFNLLTRAPGGGGEIVRVGLRYHEVAMKAQRADFRAYMDFRDQYANMRIFNSESMRRVLQAQELVVGAPWGAMVRAILDDMDEGLQQYQRRLVYHCGLGLLVSTKQPINLGDVVKKSVPDRERCVEERVGPGSVLGDEYRHLRNSLDHGTFRVLDDQRQVVFEDLDPRTGKVWHKSYSWPELMAAYVKVYNLFSAQGLAEMLEVWVLLGIFKETTRPAK